MPSRTPALRTGRRSPCGDQRSKAVCRAPQHLDSRDHRPAHPGLLRPGPRVASSSGRCSLSTTVPRPHRSGFRSAGQRLASRCPVAARGNGAQRRGNRSGRPVEVEAVATVVALLSTGTASRTRMARSSSSGSVLKSWAARRTRSATAFAPSPMQRRSTSARPSSSSSNCRVPLRRSVTPSVTHSSVPPGARVKESAWNSACFSTPSRICGRSPPSRPRLGLA